MPTVLYTEKMYPDDVEERRIFGPSVTLIQRNITALAQLPDEDSRAANGLMLFRAWMGADDFARFPNLRAVVRMGVGYDRIDRAAAARHGVIVCNVPDYGTTEVADHAISLAIALRRGLLLNSDRQRMPDATWTVTKDPVIRRFSTQGFGIVGLGRIGTAVALRAKALGFRVGFYDPHLPNGAELAVGITRHRTLDGLLAESDVLSIHAPATRTTRGLIGAAEFAALPAGAIVINTARGTTMDFDALYAAMRSGHIAAAGLDVMPTEPPILPLPALLQAFRAREPWLAGRLIVTPHSAYWSPEADWDIRIKSAETMAAALGNTPQNVIHPDQD